MLESEPGTSELWPFFKRVTKNHVKVSLSRSILSTLIGSGFPGHQTIQFTFHLWTRKAKDPTQQDKIVSDYLLSFAQLHKSTLPPQWTQWGLCPACKWDWHLASYDNEGSWIHVVNMTDLFQLIFAGLCWKCRVIGRICFSTWTL